MKKSAGGILLINALGKLVVQVTGGQAHCVAACDLEQTDALWSQLSEESGAGTFPWGNIVLLFDGEGEPTDHPFRPEHWLTPWDWALAMSINLMKSPHRMPASGFRCLIVDLLPRHFGSGGRRRFKAAGAFAPWIRWYRPTTPQKPLALGFQELFQDLKTLETLPRLSIDTLRQVDSVGLAAAWGSLFSTPKDRHAIGNLVGPLLLAEGLTVRGLSSETLSGKDRPTRRLRTLIHAVGMLSKSDTGSARPYILPLARDPACLPTSDQDPFRQCDQIRFLLVDDQYKLGYSTIVGKVLFGDDRKTNHGKQIWSGDDRKLSLRAVDDPEGLLGFLRQALESEPDWSFPRLLGAEECDVLLLDLRLFSDSNIESASNAEKKFLGRLIAFAEEFKYWEIGDSSLDAAVIAAKRRLAGGREDLHGLALLPLLLSYADPSLPIVLFSSTRQREVLETCRHRLNIITSFSKPVVTGYNVEGAGLRGVDRLVLALKTASRLHKIRVVWKALCELAICLRKTGQTTIKEPLLIWDRWPQPEYAVTPGFVRVLVAEYQRLLVAGWYADALLAPHNLLDDAGVKLSNPTYLYDTEIRFLSLALNRAPQQTWRQFLENTPDGKIVPLLCGSLSLLKPEGDTAADRLLKGAINKFSGALGRAPLPDALKEFEGTEQASLLVSRFGTLENVIEAAMELRVGRAYEKLSAASRDTSVLAAYQYYAILAAARNGRGHFALRPLEHDAVLEEFACFTWLLFLTGSTLFFKNRRPLYGADGLTPESLYWADRQDWLPKTSLSPLEGPAYARKLLANLGHLLQLGVCKIDVELARLRDYALQLATEEGDAANCPVPPMNFVRSQSVQSAAKPTAQSLPASRHKT